MNKSVKSIFIVIIGNLFTLSAGVVTGFILPKLLTVGDYGFYKNYTLYSTYIGLFSLGIIDGIVLKYGKYDYGELQREKFRAYFHVYLFLHTIIFLLILGISYFLGVGEIKVIGIFIAFEVISANCTGYFQQISQITRRFNEFSLRKILQSLSSLLVLIPMFIYYKRTDDYISYKIYIIISLMIAYALLGWYLFTYRDIVFGKRERFFIIKGEVFQLAKIGIPLMVANLCSTLILTLDRQFVNILFTNDQYAVYAFAYNLLSLITVMVSAVSTVLYPTLKRVSAEQLECRYSLLVDLMLVISFGAIALYFPLTIFINWFLPKYSSALTIFRIIFPGVALSTPITTIMHNYYKIYGKNVLFFIKGLIAIFLSIVTNLAAYFLWGTMESISIASIFTLIIWFVLVDLLFVKRIKEHNLVKTLSMIIIMMIAFYLTSNAQNPWIGFGLFILIFIVVSTIYCWRHVQQFAKRLLNFRRIK